MGRGWAGGCFSSSISFTDWSSILVSREWMSLHSFSDSNLIVAFTLPTNINLENFRERLSIFFVEQVTLRRAWIGQPSWSREARSLLNQMVKRRSNSLESSLAQVLPGSLCSRRGGIIIAAYRATDSRAEKSEYAWNSLACSRTKEAPTFPWGTFLLQWMTSS